MESGKYYSRNEEVVLWTPTWSCGRPQLFQDRQLHDGQLALTSSEEITVFHTEAPVESVDDDVTHSMDVFVHGGE